MSSLIVGALIGGTFGAAFVLANANTALGAQAAIMFRVLAIAGLVGLFVAAGKARRLQRRGPDPPPGSSPQSGGICPAGVTGRSSR